MSARVAAIKQLAGHRRERRGTDAPLREPQSSSSGAAVVLVLVPDTGLTSGAESNLSRRAAGADTGETIEVKIERAMSARPIEIVRSTKIIDKDAEGHAIVLREGSNGFACMTGNNRIGKKP